MHRKNISSQEIANIRHVITLLQSQLKADHIDRDYMMRQLDMVSALFERVEEMQSERDSAQRFEALYTVSRMLGTSLDIDTVLRQVMDAVIQITRAERGFIMLRDDDGELTVKVARNMDQQSVSNDAFQFSRSITNHAIDSGEAVLTTNAVEDPRFARQHSVMSQALKSIMVVPLWARGSVIGAAYVENRIVAGLFSDDDLTTLETFMGQAAIAIDNAMLYSETDMALQKRIEEMRELRRVDLHLNEKLDIENALSTTLSWVCKLSDVQQGSIGLVEGDAINTAAHLPDDNSNLLEQHADTIDRALTASEPVHVTLDDGSGALLALPVLREQDVIAVVALYSENAGHFTPAVQEMAERVIVRAAVSIENARLYAAVHDANIAKSEFVGVVAHDLKAPMTGIAGYTDMLLYDSDNLTERQETYLTRIAETVKHMELLVSDLADISRIESGHFMMNAIRVHIPTVVEAVRATIMPQIEARNHTYYEHVPDTLPDLYTDQHRLVQTLTNLLSNAYKYTPDGGKIELIAEQKEDRVQFTVRDSGVGMGEDEIAMLGTKFWRSEERYIRKQPGTGLGFAITASLIEQMGSRIEVESKKDVGSTFRFDVAVYDDQTT